LILDNKNYLIDEIAFNDIFKQGYSSISNGNIKEKDIL